MASFFTRALDRLTPWNRKGEVQRRQEKKKKPEDETTTGAPGLTVKPAAPTGRITVQRQQPDLPQEQLKPKQPENIFETLNKGLVFNKPNIVPVINNQDTEPAPAPKPGMVVKPAVPTATIKVPGPTIPRTPEDDVNAGLDAGKSWEDISRETGVDIDSVRNYSESTRPNYGINIKARPKQSLGNRFRDVFDANTESDKFRRSEGNKVPGAMEKPITLRNPGNIVSRTPVVGHAAKTLNTLAGQIAEIPATIEGAVFTKMQSDLTKEMIAAQRSGNQMAYNEAKRKLDLLAPEIQKNRFQQEAGHETFQKNKGGLFNAGTLYEEEASKRGDIKTGAKDIALPTAVAMLDLYTLGKGNLISEGVKEQGLRAGVRSQMPNIVKATAGNFGSGAGGTLSEGGDAEQAVKSGIINSIFGIIPDVGLPALARGFRNRVLPSIFRGRGVPVDAAAAELDDAAISASAEAANQAMRPRPISVRKNIPIDEMIDEGVGVPVRTPVALPERAGNIIREITGDAVEATPNPVIRDVVETVRREAAAADNAIARPDPRIEGVTTNPAEIVTTKDISEAQLVLDDYLQTGKITADEHKDLVEELSKVPAADAPVPKGQKIDVKMPDTISVKDETVVPTNLPEAPGTVRATTQTSPMAARTEAVANAPVVRSPAQLPAETQAILDNPKQFNKRQVAAARNQRKLARQMAKTQEDTTEAIGRLEATKSPGTPQPEGYAPTGEFGRGRRGNAYQKTSAATEAAAGAEEMSMRSVDDLLQEVGSKESFTAGDRRRITAALENIVKANPEDRETRLILKKLQSKSRTELGQGLAMIPKVVRKSATADTLVGRWESKIAKVLDDPTKMTDSDFARVQAANDKFTLARDTAANLEEQFKRTGSEADFKAWEDAYKAARQADTDAKFTEASVAQRVLKGEKGTGVNKVFDDMKKEADVNTMDTITASMLSGTGTGFRNTFGTELAGVENRIGANLRAKVTKAIFGENVGGFSRQGAREGRKIGFVKLGKDAASRAEIGGKNPLEWAKNWSTTINSAGESSLQSQVYSRLAKYYKNQFAEGGLSGKELDMRMRHAMLTDPDEMGNIFLDSAMKSSGLTGIFQKGQTIEKAVADYVGRGTDSKTAQNAAKLAMRIMVGFPTATTNFLVQSGKRLSLGMPSFIESGVKAFVNGDKKAAALAFDRGLKEAGSGAAMVGLGIALGSQGMISGAYPDDPEERAQWKRDGISENSIKIGGAWYPIPQGAGMLGLPIMFGAAIGREGDSDESVKEMFDPKNLASLLPTDQIQGFLNMASGNGAPQDLKNTIASATRAVTPAGSLWNQLAKSFDETKNDTSSKDFWSNTFDAILSGNPVTNSMADIPDATDDAGNVIKNPNPLQLALGATSAEQGAGVQRSGEIQAGVNSLLQELQQMGVTDDPNLQEVLEDDEKAIFKKLSEGKDIGEKDLKKLREAYVKGVSSEGTDTAYLERGQYDTNLAVLRLKKKLMEEDKTVRPSSLKDIDTAIKRGEVYKDNQIPYDLISEYQSVGVEEWRKMGVGPDDEDYDADVYDPEMYQKLFNIDKKLTEAGVSYRKGALDKPKYFAKEVGKGRGRGSGSGERQLDTSFGTLKDGSFAPKIQEYSSIDARSGSVPIIRTVRPNIVHKITSSG